MECNWPVDITCFDEEWDTLDEAVRDRALSLASATLTRLTGHRVSNCPVTVRPCAPRCAQRFGYSAYGQLGFYPMNWGGQWVNCCGHLACECSVLCEVLLPAPLGRVDEVKVDGEVISPTLYRMDGINRIVWTGTGDCPFPATQNLNLNDTELGTFSITYLNAYPVDGNGAYAAAVLALEYAKACSGNKKCRLPPGVTSIVRQGITMDIPTGAFPGGATGIREVDAFIALWNPRNLTHASRVWSPSNGRSGVTSGQSGVAPIYYGGEY